MHEARKIVHRDLKLDNCFVDKCMIVKIGDFGTCKLIDEESTMLKSKVGTTNYMAPEVLACQSCAALALFKSALTSAIISPGVLPEISAVIYTTGFRSL